MNVQLNISSGTKFTYVNHKIQYFLIENPGSYYEYILNKIF